MSDEGGHYYRRDGSPCYEVRNSKGGMRGINLRWDRNLNLVPSTTTVLGVVDKPALTNWKCEQVARKAFHNPPQPGETEDEYTERIVTLSKQRVIDAADEGGRIHDACEKIVAGLPVPDKYRPHAEAARAKLRELFPQVNDWVVEKSFAHQRGFGGRCDVHSPSTGIIVDYKTRDGDFTELDKYGKPKKLGWDQYWQLGSYQDGLQLPRAPGAAVFISRTHPGAVDHAMWDGDDMEKGAQIFDASLTLWKLLRNYDGAF